MLGIRVLSTNQTAESLLNAKLQVQSQRKILPNSFLFAQDILGINKKVGAKKDLASLQNKPRHVD